MKEDIQHHIATQVLEKKFQVGVKGVLVKDQKALLLRSKFQSTGEEYWDLPGGRIHGSDTSLEETLQREFAEELPGVADISVGKLLHAFAMPDDFPDGIGLFICVYRVSAKLPDVVSLSEEHTEFSWVNKAELLRLYESTDIHFREGLYQSILLAL